MKRGLRTNADARRRLPEVVLHARDTNAASLVLPRLGEPMYYYRCLVGSQRRSTALVVTMLKRAWTILEDYAVAHDYGGIGVVLEPENDQFSRQLDLPVWPRPEQRGFVQRVRLYRQEPAWVASAANGRYNSASKSPVRARSTGL